MSERETIFALASGAGRAAIAVVRLSGPGAGWVLELLSGKRRPQPRVATVATLCRPDTGERLDQALLLWFPGPASYTGEDLAELHLHGGRAVIEGVLETLGRLPGLRPAAPGEFTRRAFDHGRLDLTEAEGVIDLIDAETEAQRRQALAQLGGSLGRLYDGWRAAAIGLLARAEAAIDFVDEALPADLEAGLTPAITALVEEIEAHLADGRRGERVRAGVSVAIIGAPNVGKSSLLNALARREVAIVSSRAGTTRDVIEVTLDLAGVPVYLADTAGLRQAVDEIEDEGIRRAIARAETADLRLVVREAPRWHEAEPELAPWLTAPGSLVVLNKLDLLAEEEAGELPQELFRVSARNGQGIEALVAAMERAVAELAAVTGIPAVTRLRHRQGLEEAVVALKRALASPTAELQAEDLRLAARALGRITGRVDVEEILDLIFREFCIGK